MCAKPYQVFAYHNTSFRGEGSDDARGILDAPAVRWRDTGSGDLTEVVSYLQDFRGDVRALVHPSYGIVERERYGLTGRPEAFPAADVNFDGVVDEDDKNDFDQAHKYFGIDPATYDPRADLDRDGDVDDDDETLFNTSNGFYSGYSGQWKLSAGPGLTPGHNGAYAGLDNRFGWRGYWYDPHLRMYHVRNRAYDPRQGQFLQTDPLGFSAGDQNLYRYADGNFSSGYDPLGLEEACHDVIPGRPDLGRTCSITQCGPSPEPTPYTGVRGTPNPTLTGIDGWTGFFGGAGEMGELIFGTPWLSGPQQHGIDRALDDIGIRAQGIARATFGALIGISTSYTGVGIFWGADQIVTGLKQAITGEVQTTYLQNWIMEHRQSLQLSEVGARDLGNQLDLLGNVLFGGLRPTRAPAPGPSLRSGDAAAESATESANCGNSARSFDPEIDMGAEPRFGEGLPTANWRNGSRLPSNLREELAVREAMARPSIGSRAAEEMNDLRWPDSKGWVKYQQTFGSPDEPILVHYVYNVHTGQAHDFKIIIPGRR